MKDSARFSMLFRKYVDGIALPEERLEFFAMADDNRWQEQLAQLIDGELLREDNRWQLTPAEKGEILSTIYQRRETEQEPAVPVRKLAWPGIVEPFRRKGGTRRLRLWPRVAVAAAAVAAVTLGVWIYTSSINGRHSGEGRNPGLAYTNDVSPGRNTATLTLANGKVIDLDTNRTSVVVADSVKTTTMLTASTPRGGTYQVVLPDGSKVWLNADSRISFPSQFSGNERKILLQGEAYFEVAKAFVIQSSAKDLKKRVRQPFIVESAGQRVEVLGTHFNINSYADEGNSKTTLLEGSVNVNGIILKPKEQASLKDETLTVQQVDPAEAIDWREGLFVFNKEPLDQVMRRVARWYNVQVIYTAGFKSKDFTGSVSRFENISAVLKILELTGTVHFKIEGRKVIVMN